MKQLNFIISSSQDYILSLNIEYIFIISIIFLAGVGFLFHFIYLLIISKNTKGWNVTNGKIIHFEIYKSSNRGEQVNRFFKLEIKYEYSVNNQTYISKRVFYGDYIGRNFSNSVKKVISKYPKEKEVNVYYNKNNPAKSVLETGVNPVIYREAILGISFIIITYFMIIKKSFILSIMV